MSKIHKLADVSPEAQIGENVEIGSFCKIGPHVKIGDGCKVYNNANIVGHTVIGDNNIVYPFVSLGTAPHDLSFKGWVSYLKVGDGNTFREGFTANVGADEGTTTEIGNNCFFMANSHLGHNTKVGNKVVLANGAVLGGFAVLGDGCFIGGNSAVHQFVRIGRFVIMGGVSATSLDIPPFMIADGRNKPIRNLNLIGLKRNGFSIDTIKKLKEVFKIFFKSELNVTNSIEKIKNEVEPIPEVLEFIDFVEKRTHRGIATGQKHAR
ncbi:MAG: acyl-ACP--UDP-N-acetylglucosamine O-acyltransferase [bacterium]|nr:acyl-ACP--UDP-N-acetylglucosamine O-acyltransferase [bacterium]